MSGHEYIFIDQVILDHPLEQQAPETGVDTINFVEEASGTFDTHTLELL